MDNRLPGWAYIQLMRLDRPIGIFLLLWPTWWALWLAAQGIPDPLVLVVFTGGVVLMRSAGCVINDIADRKIDPLVRRTAQRPIASGVVTVKAALILFVGLVLLAFGLVLLLDALTILLSLVALPLAAVYPFMKRYSVMPQLYLGIAFGWAIPMAFAAQTGTIPPAAGLLFALTVVWALIYDTEYAMVDREDDLKIGVKSTAILWGQAERWVIGVLQGVFVVGLLWVGQIFQLSAVYIASVGLAALLLGYQQYLIHQRDPARCFQAFLNNHWVGLVVFVGIAGSDFVIK